MPALIAAVLVGVGAYAGFRALHRAVTSWSEIGTDLPQPTERSDTRATVEKDLGTLELDPATGVYRPVRPLS